MRETQLIKNIRALAGQISYYQIGCQYSLNYAVGDVARERKR